MADARPNVLLIVVHDLGTRLGCYGYPSVPSPALDRLAAEGVRFTRNFCTAAFCSPCRGSIITDTPGAREDLAAYDGAIRFCRTAREYMKAGRLYEQHTQIVKAQAILGELISSIDHSAAPDLGRRLDGVYHYLYDRLTQANVQDDLEALSAVIDSLTDLRAAWSDAATRWRSEAPATAPGATR